MQPAVLGATTATVDGTVLIVRSRVEGGNFDLVLYHRDYSDEIRNLLVNGTYILLDMALGEYDVMTGIRQIDHRQLPDQPEAAGLYRFKDLRSVFDEYKSKITH